MENNSGHIL